MSTSTIRELASDKFSLVVAKFEIVCSRRFCTAPRSARCVETVEIAVSSFAIAPLAPAAPDTLKPLIPNLKQSYFQF